MNISARRQRSKEPIVNVMLNGGRVTSGFRAALFASAGRDFLWESGWLGNLDSNQD